uniref:Uncharacterized protein n=1 Tax=Arundo donax TaxID=35708 RepID=A0A0A9ADT0_ARUDO
MTRIGVYRVYSSSTHYSKFQSIPVSWLPVTAVTAHAGVEGVVVDVPARRRGRHAVEPSRLAPAGHPPAEERLPAVARPRRLEQHGRRLAAPRRLSGHRSSRRRRR